MVLGEKNWSWNYYNYCTSKNDFYLQKKKTNVRPSMKRTNHELFGLSYILYFITWPIFICSRFILGFSDHTLKIFFSSTKLIPWVYVIERFQQEWNDSSCVDMEEFEERQFIYLFLYVDELIRARNKSQIKCLKEMLIAHPRI